MAAENVNADRSVRRVIDHGPENRIAIKTDEVYGAPNVPFELVKSRLDSVK